MARSVALPTITDDSSLGGAVIEKSIRFNGEDAPKMTRTFGTNTSNTTKTISFWLKRGKLGSSGMQNIFCTALSGYIEGRLRINTDDTLQFEDRDASGGTSDGRRQTTQVLRDTNSWYHIMLVLDSTLGTEADRAKIYVNGTQATISADRTISQNYSFSFFRSSAENYIGEGTNEGSQLDGYLAEINFIDGQALDPSYFGFTDPVTGIWMPKRYEGTYGTNGFYLDFSDNSSTAALGIDKSPNGNDFTANNFSVSAGAGNDSVEDTPSNNFCTLNPLVGRDGNYLTYTNGNLNFDIQAQSTYPKPVSTFNIPTSGKWYAEWVFTTIGTAVVGVGNVEKAEESGAANQLNGINYLYNGDIRVNDSFTQGSFTGWSANDVIGVKVDRDAGTIAFTLNGSAQGNPENISGMNTPTDLVFWAYRNSSGGSAPVGFVNFGQKPFSYLPSGYKSLCSQNLPPNVPSLVRPQRHFDTLLYTGNGASSPRAITGLEFAPDFVWLKSRDATYHHQLHDIIRGTSGGVLYSNNTQVEDDTYSLASFDTNGFSISKDNDQAGQNNNGDDYVAWCWKAGGAAVSNSDGTITSQVSVNKKAGFSVVTYTGDGTSGKTVGHGLDITPVISMRKARNDTLDWFVHHTLVDGSMDFLKLNTDATNSNSSLSAFTSTTLPVDDNTNQYVSYCWHDVPGFSKFGLWTSVASTNGTFINTGFKPAWVMAKQTSGGGGNWFILDNKRSSFNVANDILDANLNNAERNADIFDFLSNGFKIRLGFGSDETFIYMAFAESTVATPFDTFPNAR